MKPLVTNAGSEKQIKNAELKEKLNVDQEALDLASMLATPAGRRFLWRLLTKTRVYESIWDNSARIHYNAGQQDLGHWLQAEIVRSSEELYFMMLKENQKGPQ